MTATEVRTVPWNDTTVIVADTEGIDRADWLELRRQGIGGSDVSAIAGLSPYNTPLSVFLDKTGRADDFDEDNEAAEWGRRLEEPVADKFSDESGLVIVTFPHILASSERPWQRANVDRLAYNSPARLDDRPAGVLECKTTSAWLEKNWDDDTVPDHAALQTQWYLDILGLERAFIAALIGGNRFRHYLIERDDELIAHIRAMAEDFWFGNVQADIQPDATSVDTDLLAHLYDVRPEAVVDLDDHAEEVRDLLALHAHAKDDGKDSDTMCDEAANRLKQLIGDAEIARLDGVPVITWKQNGTFSTKQLEKEAPDVYADYLTVPAFDLERFKKEQPALYAKYRGRKFLPK